MTGLSDIVAKHRADKEFAAMRGSGRPDSYHRDSGERVPSVTTINSRFKESGGLIQWAYKRGLAGEELYAQDALDIGSIVHRMVEQRLHGDVPTPPALKDDYYERVMSAYNAFTRWFDGGRFTVVATELPLVSEVHRFGGTVDAILRDSDGQLCIGDWKTSNGIYVDYLQQLAAYGLLWDENAPEGYPITGGFHLCRFAKENGDFSHKHFPHLDDALEQFLAFRECYERDKDLKRRVK